MTAVQDSCFAIMLLWLIKALTAPQITNTRTLKPVESGRSYITFDPGTHRSQCSLVSPGDGGGGRKGWFLSGKEMMRIIQYGGSVLWTPMTNKERFDTLNELEMTWNIHQHNAVFETFIHER